jgi:hypothetical protein
MNIKNLFSKSAIIIAVAGVIGFGAFFFSGKPDSPVEQAAEAVLRTHGIDIDFSPEGSK